MNEEQYKAKQATNNSYEQHKAANGADALPSGEKGAGSKTLEKENYWRLGSHGSVYELAARTNDERDKCMVPSKSKNMFCVY